MSIDGIMQQVKQLAPQERRELLKQIMAVLDDPLPPATAGTGAEIVMLLTTMEPVELIHAQIIDPLDWLKALRQQHEDQLKS